MRSVIFDVTVGHSDIGAQKVNGKVRVGNVRARGPVVFNSNLEVDVDIRTSGGVVSLSGTVSSRRRREKSDVSVHSSGISDIMAKEGRGSGRGQLFVDLTRVVVSVACQALIWRIGHGLS